MNLRYTLLLVITLAGGLGAHKFQRNTDIIRQAQAAQHRQAFVPSPKATQVACMGFDLVIADLFWVRAVLLFVDFLDAESPDGAYWTRTVLKTVGVLDPAWRTPFFYGGGMLRLLEDVEGSDEIFTDGMNAFPEDAYFPFSLAMNAYLIHQDLDRAAEFLKRAAALPSAPRWYRTAAAEFLSRRGQRKTALIYLREQIEVANSDAERVLLENKYKSLLYEQVAEVLERKQALWEERHGAELEQVEVLGQIPPDPLGGEWFVAPDGQVRSSIHDLVVAQKVRNEERAILVNP